VTDFLKKEMILICGLVILTSSMHTIAQITEGNYKEEHRPQLHFSPQAHWMNDPNGMVYYKGVYHLFFQYYPEKTVWGPMHWGHATSKNLIHWKQQPIALYPDSLGFIFSGSAVVDYHNTTGFGKNGQIPLVAIFTHHNDKGAAAGRKDFQNQSLAYSLDEGTTWTKYAGNPVLKTPGIADFRDPKVSWYEAGKKWIMTLATQDRITFYSSKDLKNWSKESEFGATVGAHGGVWECPDLFQLSYQGKKMWVLVVNINPGAPDGGSGTQYFIGDFDGTSFRPYDTDIRWLDRGRDNYAGVTFSNTGNRKIFMGWMSNWQYAEKVPTEKWRSATTLARELGVQKTGAKYFVTAQPVKELRVIETKAIAFEAGDKMLFNGTGKITMSLTTVADFSITISNDLGERVIVGYNKASNNYYVDRVKSGKSDFEKSFAGRYVVSRLSDKPVMDITLVIDKASIELFADNGLTVLTDIFFPNKTYDQVVCETTGVTRQLSLTPLSSIWK
jgi:fructan beta-fructosidase